YEWETQNIVHLFRIITAAGSHNDIGSGSRSFLVADFRSGIGDSKNYRIRSHGAYHFLRFNVTCLVSYNDICIFQRLMHSYISYILSKKEATLVQIFSLKIDNTVYIKHGDILLANAQIEVHSCTSDGGGAGTTYHHFYL